MENVSFSEVKIKVSKSNNIVVSTLRDINIKIVRKKFSYLSRYFKNLFATTSKIKL